MTENKDDFLDTIFSHKKLEAVYIQYAIDNDINNFKIAYENYENFNFLSDNQKTKEENIEKNILMKRTRSFVYDFRNATDHSIKMSILKMFLQTNYISKEIAICTLFTESNSDNNFVYFNSPELYQLFQNEESLNSITEEYLKIFCEVLNKYDSIPFIPLYIKQKNYFSKLINSENLNNKLEQDLQVNEYTKKGLKL